MRNFETASNCAQHHPGLYVAWSHGGIFFVWGRVVAGVAKFQIVDVGSKRL